jgi:hypothetical protein
LSIEKSDLFLREGLDHPNQLESAQQIEIYAQAMLRLSGGPSEAPREKMID